MYHSTGPHKIGLNNNDTVVSRTYRELIHTSNQPVPWLQYTVLFHYTYLPMHQAYEDIWSVAECLFMKNYSLFVIFKILIY